MMHIIQYIYLSQSNQNADKIGDFANKQVDKKEGE